ncbi:hypothetical protein H2203_003918 [Taxawa tesnikishii (nom. ined.)]|nr:hypothetical protein H2203_003918 [Dothideales sp. JES 119]
MRESEESDSEGGESEGSDNSDESEDREEDVEEEEEDEGTTTGAETDSSSASSDEGDQNYHNPLPPIDIGPESYSHAAYFDEQYRLLGQQLEMLERLRRSNAEWGVTSRRKAHGGREVQNPMLHEIISYLDGRHRKTKKMGAAMSLLQSMLSELLEHLRVILWETRRTHAMLFLQGGLIALRESDHAIFQW